MWGQQATMPDAWCLSGGMGPDLAIPPLQGWMMLSQNVAWTTSGPSIGSLRTTEMSSTWRSSWST